MIGDLLPIQKTQFQTTKKNRVTHQSASPMSFSGRRLINKNCATYFSWTFNLNRKEKKTIVIR
ncbi:hypothetical protein PUN28_018311 [Cardiocondyla obscurior]|uniref:Uncharacterized protein n=1 Tax=Cardiocondyla obscurior TaxID=286306 RepID=A0AAW2EJK3_9HYME